MIISGITNKPKEPSFEEIRIHLSNGSKYSFTAPPEKVESIIWGLKYRFRDDMITFDDLIHYLDSTHGIKSWIISV